jgi:2-dehydro-3-deoxyphosphogluconate aldolase/(4S)-4-hydroxy-2-oxoglutarate aldolase
MMTKAEVRTRIQEIGIIPSIHVSSAEDAQFAAKEISAAGIPILEIATIEPGAIEIIAGLVREHPDLIVGAGELTDSETARRCWDAGAKFLSGPGVDLGVELGIDSSAAKSSSGNGPVIIPGALTPTEVLKAWKSSCDFVKVFPCAEVGGANYIKALKGPYPYIPLIASGGVNQETAAEFIMAGATALGIGGALIPHESIRLRQSQRIHELGRRFVAIVKHARSQTPHRKEKSLSDTHA